MLRELKFRAWDAEQKHMLRADLLEQGWLVKELNNPKFNVMQFTGLSDENGREIYEGDIINFYWRDYDAHFDAREVFYHVDAFCVKRDKDIILLGDVTQREVVGNIYEKP